MRALSTVIAIVLVAAFVGPRVALAQLAEARALYADGAFDGAQRAYEAALAAGGLDPAALAEVELYLGAIARAASEPDAMRAHFERAVAIDPAVQAPSNLPPRGRRVLEAARAARSGAAITVRAELPSTIPAEGAVVVHAVVEGAPIDLITSLRFTLGGWTAMVAVGAGTTEIPSSEWPREPGELLVEALTAAQNVACRVRVPVPARLEPPPTRSVDQAALLRVAPGPYTGGGPERARSQAQVLRRDAASRHDAEAPGSLLAEPAFWIVVGLVVVGAAVGVVLALTLEDQYFINAPRVAGSSAP